MDDEYKTPDNDPAGAQPPAPEGAPEPPANWNPNGEEQKATSVREALDMANVETTATVGKTTFTLKGSEISDFKAAKNYFLASTSLSIISLFFGGIILSLLAIICAIASRSRFDNVSRKHAGEPEVQAALQRSGKIALVVAICILVINIIALIYLYPMLVETMQNGGLDVLGGSSATTGSGSGNGTWG